MLFGPYEIHIYNSIDFSFTFKDFWWIPVVSSIIYLVVIAVLGRILSDKALEMYNVVIFSFTLCCYMQTMLLNGAMKVLSGEEIQFDTKTKVVNIIIWSFVWGVSFVLNIFKKDIYNRISVFMAFLISSMQVIALVSLLFSTGILEQEKDGYLTTKNMLNLSAEESNVVVFILDTFDVRFMEGILAEEPEYLDKFTNFMYFPNALGTHSRTYPSITYLLTGEKCYFDREAYEYIDESFEKSDFFPLLVENNIDIGLYTFIEYIGKSVKEDITNYVPSKGGLRYKEVQKALFDMTLYRDLPYIFKESFSYSVDDINYNASNNVNKYKNSDDEWFYNQLLEKGIQNNQQKSAFRFYHLCSCHHNLSQPLYYGKRSLDIVYEYIQQMKEKDVYDNTTIIITTDHASSGGGENLDMPHETAATLFLVKPQNKSRTPLEISLAPISQEDFIPSVLDGLGIENTTKSKTFFQYTEEEERERYYYYTALQSHEEGEIELREYQVVGDAREAMNYLFTGNVWPVKSSLNKVMERK